jgi:pyruvate formate lyase activating enzyme
LKCGLGLAGLGAATAAGWYGWRHAAAVSGDAALATDVFRQDAPRGELWEQWQQRGWVQEGRHYLKLASHVQCKLCPNECLLKPEDRGRCRNRVNKDGQLYTLAYGNACAFHLDPIEKKPLYHFLPNTEIFSFAASGCGFRCLNCQNWEISQRKPEQTKDPSGPSIRLSPLTLATLTRQDEHRVSLFPEDAVALAEHFQSPSLAYTYTEPSNWFEYMLDTARLARSKGLKNVWVTCGYIQQKPLRELCRYLDAANVDLKGFDPALYGQLNSGKLPPVLETLKTLKREGVWLEVGTLIVPTYTDQPDMLRRMCAWLVDQLGPDCPMHFLRFHPAHKLAHLPPTPEAVLTEAREIARECGLHYVYIGNLPGVENAGTTRCPHCGRSVIEREVFSVVTNQLRSGACRNCGTLIAGVWHA